MVKWEPSIGCGVCRPEESATPRRMRTVRTPPTERSPRKASGAESQTNSTPSSSACSTSRCEPGMLLRLRR